MVDPRSHAPSRQLPRFFASTARLGLVFGALGAFGCQGSASGNASAQRVKMDAEEGPDFNKPITTKELSASGAPPAATAAGVTLLGARRDLRLVAEHANVECACVKVGLGSASSAAFRWQSDAPLLNDDTQLAFAMSTENVPCSGEPKGSTGASYWGYRIEGNNVIVFLEGVPERIPRTSAAIIPKPVGNGQVYLAPAKSKFPYGRSLDGKARRCKVGNVATMRVTPFTRAELGDSSAHDANAPTVDSVE